MLQRDLAVQPPPEALSLLISRCAAQVRVVAEERALAVSPGGYAYAEKVYPWIRPLIDAGDLAREKGEDLAFASTDADWARGQKELDEAWQKYEQSQAVATAVRSAYAASDRALAELPGHARWLAGVRRGPDDLPPVVVRLFDEARQLERMQAEKPSSRPSEKLEEMRRRGRRLEEGLDSLQKSLDGFAQTCESNTPTALTDAEVVLEAPALAAELRWRLVRELGRLARRAVRARKEP